MRRTRPAATADHVIFGEALTDDLDAVGMAYGPGEFSPILKALAAQQRIALASAGVDRSQLQRSCGWFITTLPALLADARCRGAYQDSVNLPSPDGSCGA